MSGINIKEKAKLAINNCVAGRILVKIRNAGT
jgi:hypothetical protein